MSAVGSSRTCLTERKNLKVRRTINMSLLRSEENLRSQNLARKTRSRRFVTQSKPSRVLPGSVTDALSFVIGHLSFEGVPNVGFGWWTIPESKYSGQPVVSD